MRSSSLLALAALLVLPLLAAGCSGSSSSACVTPLAAAHLIEGYCDNASGFCFHDHETPF